MMVGDLWRLGGSFLILSQINLQASDEWGGLQGDLSDEGLLLVFVFCFSPLYFFLFIYSKKNIWDSVKTNELGTWGYWLVLLK